MLGKDYEGQDCALARALEVVGERWTLLIVRDTFFGVRRFGDFVARLGGSLADVSAAPMLNAVCSSTAGISRNQYTDSGCLLILSFWRFSNQRWKFTEYSYLYYIELELSSSSREAARAEAA